MGLQGQGVSRGHVVEQAVQAQVGDDIKEYRGLASSLELNMLKKIVHSL